MVKVFISSDKCENFCENNGICKKDKDGEAYCTCSGSFTGSNCQASTKYCYFLSTD